MSHNQPNNMDGVPVKISEKYKPPPKISLPQSIVQRLVASDVLDQTKYDFSLERNVLIKIAEWKSVRNRDQTERRERIRQRQLERQHMADERQKQMLTAVSYPNAEDLSDDESEPVIKQQLRFNSPNFDTILLPTVMNGHDRTHYEQSTNLNHNPYRTTNSSKINYSDFENDTSSPFDNIELKTINDLDILAQVLNMNSLKSNETSTPETSTESTASSDNTPIQQTILPSDNILETNGGQPSNEAANYNVYSSVTSNPTERLTEFPRYASKYHSNKNYFNFNNQVKLDQHLSNVVDQRTTVIPNSEFYYDYNSPTLGHCYPLTNHNYNYHQVRGYETEGGVDSSVTMCIPLTTTLGNLEKLKSKSVPDILKELNDEVRNSEMKRQRNNSQSVARPIDDNEQIHAFTNNQVTKFDSAFHNLPLASQKLIKNISSMGFDQDRVCRIAEKFGNDDKKIVEHLIALGELLDLGFDETKISDALIRFGNNKDKALDYLIS